MPSTVKSWPPWPQFIEAEGEKRPRNAQYKQEIVREYGADSIRRSWIQTCQTLGNLASEINRNGRTMIPTLSLEDFLDATDEKNEELKEVGCFVIRGVIPKPDATAWVHSLKEYVADNKEVITGWPLETPVILDIFHSPSQQAVRSHPNILKVTRQLNALWHDDASATSNDQLSYADGARIRAPQIPVSIGPHIDAGSLARWADPTYRSIYAAIWSGKPDLHDPYDLTLRKDANPKLFPGSAHCSVFRTFQGWTALTEAGPSDGSLLVYPNLKAVLAYVLLRPFFDPPASRADLMHAEKWSLNPESTWFPGTFSHDSQQLSPESHPHLRLDSCLVSIPRMYPGDTVWWHTDMCHAVEVDHTGQVDASVVYVGAVPTTPDNVLYVRDQWTRFKKGLPPGDFEHGQNESRFKGYLGEEGILGGDVGKRAAGWV